MILGIVLTTIRPDKLIIPVCMAYSIIPDILDKYLGLTYAPLNSGRTVAHSLLFIGVISFFLVAIVIYTHRHAILLLAAPLALILHQLLDEIWKLPTTWFYPLLGPFLKEVYGIGTPLPWFWGMVTREIADPVEWISGFALLFLLYLWYGHKLGVDTQWGTLSD